MGNPVPLASALSFERGRPMTKWHLTMACVAVVLFAWLFRYDAKPIPTGFGGVYVTDRWTGTISYCLNGDCDRHK
jgi:hypothetical protein